MMKFRKYSATASLPYEIFNKLLFHQLANRFSTDLKVNGVDLDIGIKQ